MKLGPIKIIKGALAYRRGKRKAEKEMKKMAEGKILVPIQNDPVISARKATTATKNFGKSAGWGVGPVVGLIAMARAFGWELPWTQDADVAVAAGIGGTVGAIVHYFKTRNADMAKQRFVEVDSADEGNEQ